MSLLVFGRTGQVGRCLMDLAPNARFVGRDEADLAEPETCAALIRESRARQVINAAAYTAVDRAEEEESLAAVVNGTAPGAMAEAAAATGASFVHLSTDYVFDGTGSAPWTVEAIPVPLGAYGRTKWMGEDRVREAGGAFAILRTSWVFSEYGNNFVTAMLRLSESCDRLNVVADQVGGPTPAHDIARAALCMAQALPLDPAKAGLYHFAGAPEVSWADFAREIFRQADRTVEVRDIGTEDYPTPAKRPRNSRLDCRRTAEIFGIDRPHWHAGLARVLSLKENFK